MLEFLSLCFAPINLVFTVLLSGVICYWVMFLVGAVGLDVFDGDVDLDLDADVDVDLDLDVDADVEVGAGDVDADAEMASGSRGLSGKFVSLLRFLDVGDVPLMVLLSGFVVSMWAVSVLSSHYFNPGLSLLIAIAWLIPNFIVSLFLTKLLTWPARQLFRHGNLGIEAPAKIVGKTCIITTSTVTLKFGQAEIEQEGGAPITLNVRCKEGSKPLKKGDEALILDLNEENSTYIVVPFDLEVN